MKNAIALLTFLLLCALPAAGCRREAPSPQPPAPAASPAETTAPEPETPASAWQEQAYTIDGMPRAISVQFPQNFTPLRAYPLLFFYPGTAHETMQTRIALLVDAQTKPAAAAGWPERIAAENALVYLDNNLQALARSRLLVIPFTGDAIDFACTHAWHFDGLVIQCDANIPMPRLEAALLGNLAPLPVFIDNSGNADPPDTARLLTQMLRQAGVAHVAAPEYLLESKTRDEVLAEAAAFLSAHAPEKPEAAFNWNALWLRHGRAHWLRMDAFDDFDRPAEVRAEVLCDGSHRRPVRLKVATSNLTALSVQRDFPGFRADAPLVITLDGQDILVGKEAPSDGETWCLFRREGAEGPWRRVRHQPAGFRKSASCEGPIAAFLESPFVILTPTGDETQAGAWRQAALAFAQEFGARFGYTPPVLADKEFRPAEATGRNLLLFGPPESNLLSATLLEGDATFLPALYDKLPEARRQDDALCCMVLQAAGLLHPGRLALLVFGNSSDGMAPLLKPLLKPGDFGDCDYMLYEKGGQPVCRGILDAEWNLPNP